MLIVITVLVGCRHSNLSHRWSRPDQRRLCVCVWVCVWQSRRLRCPQTNSSATQSPFPTSSSCTPLPGSQISLQDIPLSLLHPSCRLYPSHSCALCPSSLIFFHPPLMLPSPLLDLLLLFHSCSCFTSSSHPFLAFFSPSRRCSLVHADPMFCFLLRCFLLSCQSLIIRK